MEKTEVQLTTSRIQPVIATITTHHSQPDEVRTSSTWPKEPKILARSTKERFIWTAYDLALVIVPIGLIVKTGLVILASRLDGNHRGIILDEASSLSRYLVSLNSQLVTLFTIVFVTIISTFVKRYALWKAQKGAYLSELEQLQGSVSLPSTVKLIWSLRSFSIRSVLLVSVWAFYYLGSQAAKDEYVLSNSDRFVERDALTQPANSPTIFAADTGNLSGFFNLLDSKHDNTDLTSLNFAFAAALITKDAQSQRDDNTGTNSGPLIPDFDTVLTTHVVHGLIDRLEYKFGWVDVSRQSQNFGKYTNLQGVTPVVVKKLPPGSEDPWGFSLNEQLLGSYQLNTSYLSVGCSNLQVLPLDAYPNGTTGNSTYSFNVTSYRPDAPRDAVGNPLREFNFWYRTSIPLGESEDQREYHALRAVCNITTKMVDVRVSCLTNGCFPQAMRWQNNTNAETATSFSTPFDSEEYSRNFLSNITLSTGPASDWVSGPESVLFYQHITTAISFPYNASDPIPWQGFVDELQLTRLFNTYTTVSQAQVSRSAFNTWSNGPGFENLLAGAHNPALIRQEVKGALFERGYRINWAWIPIDFAASLILLAAAIASWRLRLMTLAPDIFGYVSSMTRDNERVLLPSEGSMLSGMERARMLKHVKVKIGEVQTANSSEEGSIGVIGLAPVDMHVSGLQRERLYS